MIILTPYNLGSESAKVVAEGLGALRSSATKRFKRTTKIINWGRSQLDCQGLPTLNRPEAVAFASNKLRALERMRSNAVPTVEFTTDINAAKAWLTSQDSVVYGRRILNGSQGEGIALIKSQLEFISCPLYTRGITNTHEYRVHVFKGRVLDVTKKRRRSEIDTDQYIRNSANGWVFCRNSVVHHSHMNRAAIKAVASLGLDFGAVDVLLKNNKPYVLEVNTAPGVEGTTLERYVKTFRRYYESL